MASIKLEFMNDKRSDPSGKQWDLRV